MIADSNILVHDHLKILGVIIDKKFTIITQAQSIVKSCNYHIQALRRIRHLLSRDIANTIACSIVGSRLDYCNSLFHGSTEAVLNSLQRIQNNSTRTVLHSGSYNNSLSNLRELHWLPICERIRFKIANLCYRAVRVGQPLYLAELIADYRPVRLLRSADGHFLTEPRSKTVIANRRFSCAAPHIWNSLPPHVRTASSIESFRSQLKSYLFSAAFDAHP